jgi:ligand-binding sensor domain-containing protein
MYCGLVLKFTMQNGEFSIINESNGLGHNSCWDISQDIDGNMWFASYGGVSVSLMGKVSPFYY